MALLEEWVLILYKDLTIAYKLSRFGCGLTDCPCSPIWIAGGACWSSIRSMKFWPRKKTDDQEKDV